MDADADRAPGALDLIRRFVNTLDYPAGPDVLGTTEKAAEWCRAHGLPPPSDGRELERLLGFREALRRVLAANNHSEERASAWEALRTYLTTARFSLALRPPHVPTLEPAGDGIDRTIATLLALVYDAISAGTWQRMRACRKESCRFAYYDRSKNGSRAWCSMAICGNREKAQRRRTRERHDVA